MRISGPAAGPIDGHCGGQGPRDGADRCPADRCSLWPRRAAAARGGFRAGVRVAALWLGLALATPAALADGPQVVVTIKPVHSLVAGLLEGIARPDLLLDGPASPHTYSLKPSDARSLDKADLFVRVGPSVEPFTERIISSLPSRVEVVTLQEVAGLELRNVRTGAAFEAHDHGHDTSKHAHSNEKQKHAHKGKHAHKDEHRHASKGKAGTSKDHDHGEGHEDAGVDGHIWLDPVNARKLVAHLQGVLGRRYPELAGRLAANAGALTARLDELESQLAERMRPLAGRSFIVFHDAYQYFEARFGLTAAGAITVNPEVPPGAKRISQLRARIKEAGARCVFAEPQFRAKVIDSITEGTKARSAVIDPIGADVAAGSEHYFKMMGNLAASFEACLADPS